jgi:steroid delta-isomerase-like uncharacterized protein
MTESTNERAAHQWHLEMVQEGKLDLANQVLAPDVVVHAAGQDFQGADAAKALAQGLKGALPDMQITHHDVLSDGDQVAIRWTATATHGGDYFGVPASGNSVNLTGIDWFRFRDGKISELWIEYDNAGVLQQMGVVAQAV